MNSLHSHPAFEIYFLEELQGVASITINGKEYELKKNSLVIIDSLTSHKTNFSKAERHTRVLIEVSPTIFDKKIIEYFNISINEFFHLFTGVHTLSSVTLEKITNTLNYINNEYLYKKNDYEKIIILHLLEMIITIQRDNFIKLNNKKIYLKQNYILEPIIGYINEHFLLDITLSSISKLFFIDCSYLSRLFKEHAGHTVHQYINFKRIAYAQRFLLINQDISINDMASSCGFNNVNTFINTFKKITDLTPLQYRKKFG